MTKSPEADDTLWKILPTTFKDHLGREWSFKHITARDILALERRGITTEDILTDMKAVPFLVLSHEFLDQRDSLPLDDYLDLLFDDYLDGAVEAFKNALTNFFPRNSRIAVRQMFRAENHLIEEMARNRAETLLTTAKREEQSGTASDGQLSSDGVLTTTASVS